MKKLLSALSISTLALSACGGGDDGGIVEDNSFKISETNSTMQMYAGSMVGEEPVVGRGLMHIQDAGKSHTLELDRPQKTPNYKVVIEGNIDTSTPGTYDAKYYVEKNGVRTKNFAKLQYTVYSPGDNVRSLKADELSRDVNILYVQVNTADNATLPTRDIVGEYEKQMEEAYNYAFSPLNFQIDTVFVELDKKSPDYLEEWKQLPEGTKTDGERYGLDYYIITQALKKEYKNIEWKKYDAISANISRADVPNDPEDAGSLGLAATDVMTVEEFQTVLPNLSDDLKKPMETPHKGPVGIGYNRYGEQLIGSANYHAKQYMATHDLSSDYEWNQKPTTDPQQREKEGILNSEIGTANLNGKFDFSRMSTTDFPTVKSNSMTSNGWYYLVNTLMHETIHAFSVDHSKATRAISHSLYSKFLAQPWSRKGFALPGGGKTDAECKEIQVANDTECDFLYNDYLDPFDNMSQAELTQRFTANSRGVFFGIEDGRRIVPTSTPRTITVKPGAKETWEVYLEDAMKGARDNNADTAKDMHVMNLEFLGNDQTTSHFNDYQVLKDNLNGVLLRYTMINLSKFSRDAVILDGNYDPNDASTFTSNDYKFAFAPGTEITFQGVKFEILSVDQAAGAQVRITKV